MTSDDFDRPARDEVQAFRDSVTVISTRQEWDRLLLDALCAPGLGAPEADRLARFVTAGRLNAGQEALDRIASWTKED